MNMNQLAEAKQELYNEINQKIITLHGTPDVVMFPLYFWEKITRLIEEQSRELNQLKGGG